MDARSTVSSSRPRFFFFFNTTSATKKMPTEQQQTSLARGCCTPDRRSCHGKRDLQVRLSVLPGDGAKRLRGKGWTLWDTNGPREYRRRRSIKRGTLLSCARSASRRGGPHESEKDRVRASGTGSGKVTTKSAVVHTVETHSFVRSRYVLVRIYFQVNTAVVLLLL